MKINRIVLHNFKSFEGTVELTGLDRTRPDQPIILIGGLNGAGKTSLLEAILLVLYGKSNKTLFPTRGARREDYGSYICALLNNRAKTDSYLRPTMWVEIGLSGVYIGDIPQNIVIRRTWILDTINRKVFEEKLEITDSNGKNLEYVEKDHYDKFIEQELIPYGISKFFLFDGENIQDFVRDEDKEFADSLEQALGLDLYRILKEDLEKTRRDLFQEYNRDKESNLKIKEIEAKIEDLKIKIENAEQEIATKLEEIESNKARIEEIDRETERITSVKAESREDYERRKSELDEEKGRIKSEIESAISDIPFAIMGKLCNDVLRQLQIEDELQNFEAAGRELNPKIRQIAHELFEGDKPDPPLTDSQFQFYQQKLERILRDVLNKIPSHLREARILHGLSKGEIDKTKQKINSVWSRVQALSEAAEKWGKVIADIRKIETSRSTDSDPEVIELYKERGTLDEKNKTHQREIGDRLQPSILKWKEEISAARRQMTNLEEKVQVAQKVKNQIDYCNKLIEAIDEFRKRFREQRVKDLENHTLEMLTHLSRKRDFVSKIKILPDENFSVRLYDGSGQIIDKTKISKGEKELVAISLIWALSKLANKAIPLIIDTPLARLDSEHRKNIVTCYYPIAGGQVILLSTDTEVVGDLFDAIKSRVNQTYRIVKENALTSSKFIEGYFNSNGPENQTLIRN
jgi:DNA sulfur modification protein DndD